VYDRAPRLHVRRSSIFHVHACTPPLQEYAFSSAGCGLNVRSDMLVSDFNLLGISGSLRRNSACTAILATLAGRLPCCAAMTVAPLHQLPLYNEDEDRGDALRQIESFRSGIEAADGLLVISPEYSHGISGVLKNAIDLVSRPGYDSVLKNKPVLVMSASNSPLGGVRAQMQLRETFASTLSRVVARRQVVIGQALQKVVDGKLVHEPTLEFIDDAIGDLLDEISLMRRASQIDALGSLIRSKRKHQLTAEP
jgi:chromate reductase, NAD(P)H dehydrogenase (quinone)